MFEKDGEGRDRPSEVNWKRKDDVPGQRGWRVEKQKLLSQEIN